MNKEKHKLPKEVMEQYLPNISKGTTDGFIFQFVRQVQNSALDQGVDADNWSEFYWFLKDYRDSLKEEKDD